MKPFQIQNLVLIIMLVLGGLYSSDLYAIDERREVEQSIKSMKRESDLAITLFSLAFGSEILQLIQKVLVNRMGGLEGDSFSYKSAAYEELLLKAYYLGVRYVLVNLTYFFYLYIKTPL